MAEPRFADDDDLPRTLRRARDEREREARARELLERETRAREQDLRDAELDRAKLVADTAANDRYAAPRAYGAGDRLDDDAAAIVAPGTVTRLQIPFFRLMFFFLKATLAAIPALMLLAVVLWLAGKGVAAYFPNLARMQIFIQFPQ